jgi:NAD(P)-dependent dehydrogenase (short-subunit alcohol dehydrogenase family)
MSPSPFDLTGRAALVTGGSRGLGLAIARAFAEAGADVLLSSRHEPELAAAAAEITRAAPGRRAEWIAADLTRRGEAPRLARAALERLGRIDILVANAGTNVPEPIDQVADDTWDAVVEINLTSCMALTRALAGPMKERRWGRVLYTSSVLGLGGKEARNAYCATKSALVGLARAAALDLGPFNVTVNCIAPGPFLTDLPGRLLSEEQKRRFAERTALGRWGKPEEIAGAALLLASEAGSYITGSTLLVDGGCLARTL